MLEKFWKHVNKGEEARRSALKPDEVEKERIKNPNLGEWMGEAKMVGLDGEVSEEAHEFTAGEFHAKEDAKEKLNHPHLELLKKTEVEKDEIVTKIEAPLKNEVSEKRKELLLELNLAQEKAKVALHKVADIRAKLEALEVEDARGKVEAA